MKLACLQRVSDRGEAVDDVIGRATFARKCRCGDEFEWY